MHVHVGVERERGGGEGTQSLEIYAYCKVDQPRLRDNGQFQPFSEVFNQILHKRLTTCHYRELQRMKVQECLSSTTVPKNLSQCLLRHSQLLYLGESSEGLILIIFIINSQSIGKFHPVPAKVLPIVVHESSDD